MIDQAKNIFIVGIKGVMMANLAIVLKQMSKNVTGYDVDEVFITDKLLKERQIKYSTDLSDFNLLNGIDLIIYSAAHFGTNNPYIIEAKKRKIMVKHQIEVISQIMDKYKHKIAITGCHGKTTTSALLAYTLQKLGVKPGYLIGAPSFNSLPGGEIGEDDYFVVEADEYGLNPPTNKIPKFNLLNPDYIICTNIDFDHPDVYKDIEETKRAFKNFFGSRKLIVCADDKNLMEVIKDFPKDQYTTYSFSTLRVCLSIFGKKNISNASAVVTLLLQLGFSRELVIGAIKAFSGAKRRFEFIYFKNNIFLYDDYGHHPTEIKTTINLAQDHFPNKKIIVIFQPHTYSRTLSLKKEFAQVLSLAHQSYVLPIFSSAREKVHDFKISSNDIEKIAKKNGNNNVIYVNSKKLLTEKLFYSVNSGDVIITMGAGDVYKLKDDIIKIIDLK